MSEHPAAPSKVGPDGQVYRQKPDGTWWWRASDGKWYPEESYLGHRPPPPSPPAVPAPASVPAVPAPPREERPASERVVVQAPMSFSGSARRIWKLTGDSPAQMALVALPALMLIALAWIVVAGWYCLFGILVVPWRLIRRGSRKRKQETLRHREMLRGDRR